MFCDVLYAMRRRPGPGKSTPSTSTSLSLSIIIRHYLSVILLWTSPSASTDGGQISNFSTFSTSDIARRIQAIARCSLVRFSLFTELDHKSKNRIKQNTLSTMFALRTASRIPMSRIVTSTQSRLLSSQGTVAIEKLRLVLDEYRQKQ